VNLAICAPVDPRPLAAYLDSTAGGIPTGLGGASVVALTRAALQAGWKVTLFSLDPGVLEETVLSGPRLKICLCPFRARGRARDLFRVEREFLTRAIRRECPELLHAHWTYEFALAALDSGTPTLVTAHDRPLRILRWDHSPYRCMRTWMAAQVAHRARWMTAVSGGVADHFRRYFGCRAPMPVIPNGLDDSWFEAAPPPAREAGFIFAAVLTGWGPLKNGRALLHAFRLIRESLPECRLHLFGDDNGPGEAAELWAKRRQLTDGVVFWGQMEQHELRQRLRAADVLVHPSLEESYSMVTAEAMALGIPVIASRGSGGIAETLDGGSHAVLTDATRPQSLAQAMLRLARSPELRGELASGAQAAVRSQFPIRNVLESYAHLYRALGAA
jgi:glycosyltransferase involved in cell wall biosynthesis